MEDGITALKKSDWHRLTSNFIFLHVFYMRVHHQKAAMISMVSIRGLFSLRCSVWSSVHMVYLHLITFHPLTNTEITQWKIHESWFHFKERNRDKGVTSSWNEHAKRETRRDEFLENHSIIRNKWRQQQREVAAPNWNRNKRAMCVRSLQF
jgi:hypothetical protein